MIEFEKVSWRAKFDDCGANERIENERNSVADSVLIIFLEIIVKTKRFDCSADVFGVFAVVKVNIDFLGCNLQNVLQS